MSSIRLRFPTLLPRILLGFSLTAGTCVAQTNYTVNGWPLGVSLTPDKTEVMVGEPVFLTYRVENASDTDLRVIVGGDYRNRLGRPERFAVTITDETSTALPVPDAGPGFGGIVGPQKLSAGGKHETPLFLSDWGMIKSPGVYSITVKRTLNLTRENTPWDSKDATHDVATVVESKLKVVAFDPRRMDALIAGLAAEMLGREGDRRERATKMLCFITDERVIPPLLKAAESQDYSLRFQALCALGKFAAETTVAGLEKGLATTWRDMGNCTTEQVAESCAENIRTAAAQTLMSHPNPRAQEVLLAHRHDPSRQVRLTAVHLLGRMKTVDSVKALREMVNDEYELVRNEATRYLHERKAPFNQVPEEPAPKPADPRH